MFIENLKKLFEEVEDNHRKEPARYYFKEGQRKGVISCSQVLKYLKKLKIYSYITREEALPDHPAFRQIQEHIFKIMNYYPDEEINLTCLILRKLLPQNPLPFRSSVLNAISLRSAVIYISDIDMKPVPIPAHIDGYYDFVAPIADNELHIPLITENPEEPAVLPPSIHFIDDDNISSINQKTVLLESAPKTGRLTQFHAFVSLLSRSNPLSDMMQLFHDSLNSSDLTFASSVAVLAANEPAVISALLRVLYRDNILDHFLRSLCCSVRKVVVSGATSGNLEMAALSNAFVIASEGCWYCTREVASITQLLFTICNMLKRGVEVPPLALYILRCALTIAAYEDACGDAAIGMLMELVFQPFVAGSKLESQLANMKRAIILYPESRQRERASVEQTIISVLEQEIIIKPTVESDEKKDIELIYKFCIKNADPFVRMAIVMNSKSYLQHPAVQAIMFAFQKSNEIRTLETCY